MNRIPRVLPFLRRIIDTCAVALSAASALGLVKAPGAAMTVVSFYALLIVPGASLRRIFFPSTDGAVARAAEAFLLGVVFASAAVCLGFVPGVSYGAIAVVAGVSAIVLAWIPPRPAGDGAAAPGSGARIISELLVAVAAVACFFALFGRGELGWSTDALDHVSYVRRSAESGALFPRDSFFRDGDGAAPDARKGLWHPVLSLWVRESGTAADAVWRMVPSLAVFFALCAFHRFAAAISGAGWAAWLATLLLVFFAAGEGPGWFAKIGFSRNMALVLFWGWIGFLVRWCVRGRRSDLAALFLVAAAGTAIHVSFALFVVSGLAAMTLYALLSREGSGWRRPFAAAAGASAIAVAAPLLARIGEAGAPRNAIHTHLQGMLRISDRLAIVDPAEVATRLGLVFLLAILIAPFFLLLSRGRGRRGLVLALFAVPVLVVFDPVCGAFLDRRIGYLHYRMLDAAPTAVFMALALVGLVRVLVRGSAGPRGEGGPSIRAIAASLPGRILALAALVLFAAFPARIAVREARAVLAGERGKAAAEELDATFVRALEERLPARATIVSDPRTSYFVSAYTDHFVAVTLDQHGSPADTLALERLRSVRDLLSPAVPAAASVGWLAASGADYVVVNEGLGEGDDFFGTMPPGGGRQTIAKLDGCPSLFEPVGRLAGFSIYRVRREGDAAAAGACAEPLERPRLCAADSIGAGASAEALVVATASDAGAGIALAGLVLDRYTLRTIDTLTGHFCWKAARPVSYGLPFEIVVRLDTAFPKGRFYRDWYGKQYRRVVERRERRWYRFTWTARLRSGSAQPDLWRPGETRRQDFAIPLPSALAPGAYEMRVLARRAPYLPVRTPADYLSNEDSQSGTPVGMVYVQ